MDWGKVMIKKEIKFSPNNEKGSTLLVVLFLLLIIMVVGTYAIKTGMNSLRISTNAQINELLTQSADTPLNKYLNISDLNSLMSYSTAVGAAIDEKQPNREFIFCYKPTVNRIFGSILDTSVLAAKDDSDQPVQATYCRRGSNHNRT